MVALLAAKPRHSINRFGENQAIKPEFRSYHLKIAKTGKNKALKSPILAEQGFDIERILMALQIESKQTIAPQKTLIILDEIQECPQAITSLKYFCENASEYAVVAAGSLLGLTVHHGTGYPVGKVDTFNLYPLSFREFLIAMAELDEHSVIEGNTIYGEFKGSLTEQYVCQQLIADQDMKPYYWSAENSTGEIDFIISNHGKVFPLEVKAEENLRARSLRMFSAKHSETHPIRLSLSNYREETWMTNVPLYMVGSWRFGPREQ